ncbi:MAG: hypothetical protein R2727_08415 [Bacteroidales bacterium]
MIGPDYLSIIDQVAIEVLYNASIYRDINGQIHGVFAAARDVTQQNRATELIILNRELAVKNSEREKWEKELLMINQKLELAREKETIAKEKYIKLYNFCTYYCYFTPYQRGHVIVDVNNSGAGYPGTCPQWG